MTIASLTVQKAIDAAAHLNDRGFIFVDEFGTETSVSFRDLVAEVRRRGAALQSLGLRRGDRVALILPEHRSFVVTFFAALAAGLVPVPMYPPLSMMKLESWRTTADGILNVADVSAIVTVADLRALLWSMAARLGARILTIDEMASCTGDFTPAEVGLDELAFLQFTSGSTAAPKGVMVSHRNIAANCAGMVGDFLHAAPDEVGVSWLPLYHDMGLIGFVLAPLLAARPVVLLDTPGFMKRPLLWLELIDRHRATVTCAPNFAYALAARRAGAVDISRWDLSCLRVAACGGEPVSPHTFRTFAERFAPAGLRPEALHACYGMAEATLAITCERAGKPWRGDLVHSELLRIAGEAVAEQREGERLEIVSCGTPLAGHTVHVVDDVGRQLPERRVGEVEFEGPSVTLGYFGNAAATAESYRDGRLRTGDLGYIADGALFVTGRRKDLIIVRGRNYAPQAIEWCAAGIPGVRDGSVAAFGRPAADGGEEVVIACEAATTDRAALARKIQGRISDALALTVSDVVIFRPGLLPKTSSGKVQRSRARALYLDGTMHRLAASRRPVGLMRRLLVARMQVGTVLGRLRYGIGRALPSRRRAHTGSGS